jgi:hypothetical protein
MTFYKSQIKATPEFNRIVQIPRRVWSDEEGQRIAAEMTQA